MIRLIILGLMVACSFGFGRGLNDKERAFGKRQAAQIQAEFRSGRMEAIASRTDQALHGVVQRAIHQLHKKGYHKMANQYEDEWNNDYRGYLTAMVQASSKGIGDIGDHKPLIQWLANFYDRIEGTLGVDVCKMFHLSDIKTFNYCIPIVFHPCTFDMDKVSGDRRDEYRRHMQKGAVYDGLLPVVTYWVCDIACMFGTAGIATLFCGPVAGVAEAIMEGPISGKISDKVYDRACGP